MCVMSEEQGRVCHMNVCRSVRKTQSQEKPTSRWFLKLREKLGPKANR